MRTLSSGANSRVEYLSWNAQIEFPARPGEKRSHTDIQVVNCFWRKLLVVIAGAAARRTIRPQIIQVRQDISCFHCGNIHIPLVSGNGHWREAFGTLVLQEACLFLGFLLLKVFDLFV